MRRCNLRDLPIGTAEGIRKLGRELVVGIGFVCGNSRREFRRAIRDRRRISEHVHALSRRADGENAKITVAEISAISLPLKIGEDLNRTVAVGANRRPRLHSAIYVTDSIV